MNSWEPRWLASSNLRRLLFYVLAPVLLCAVGVYEQSTWLERYYLFPYLESSVFRHSPAATTGVQMYWKVTKDGKMGNYLKEADVVPMLVTVGNELPFELSPEARKQGWDHFEKGRRVQINCAALAEFLESNIFDGESLWALLRPFWAGYYVVLLSFIFLRLCWLDRAEILQWTMARWRSHREQKRKIEVQMPVPTRSLPAPPRPLLNANSPQDSEPKSSPARGPEAPANSSGWNPSLWVDRAEMQSGMQSDSAPKDEETD
jgi:hypothetical protein